MLKRDPNFRRLKIAGRGWAGPATYWLGKDHLLVVEVSNYTERYRRFYFRDIQAIVVQQNKRQFWINLILGMLLLLVVFLAAVTVPSNRNWEPGDYLGVTLVISGAAILLLVMLRNSFLGRTCSVMVRTAVQTQKLKNLGRWRAAEKLIASLQPLILAAQPPVESPAAAGAPDSAPPAAIETSSADGAATP